MLVELEARPVWTIIRFSSEMNNYTKAKILGDLREVLRGRPDGYQHMPKYKSRRWDGWISLMQRNKFPTGLLHIATEKLDQLASLMEFTYKVNYTHVPVVDTHHVTTEAVKLLRGKDRLRPYQRDAVKVLAREKRGIAHMATNAGKTYVMAALINVIGGRTLIIVHGKELLHQIADVMRAKTKNMTVGLIGDGHMDLEEDIIIATIQTLSKKADGFSELFEQIDILMIDEVHHASAKTVYETVMKIPAIFRFGFSGTPLKNKVLADLQLMATTGRILVHVSNEELIEAGYSATPEITMYRINGVKDDSIKYQQAYADMIVRNPTRNNKIAGEAVRLAKKGNVVLVLTTRIDHQKYIASSILLQHMYSNYTTVNGMNSTKTRRQVLQKMRDGIGGIYIATGIFGEGVDIPAVDVLINAGAGKSHIELLQKVGRGLRKKAGENKVTIIDFMDTANKYLIKHAKKRKSIYENEGFTVKVI